MKTGIEGNNADAFQAGGHAASEDARPMIALLESDAPEHATITAEVNQLDLATCSEEARAWAKFLQAYVALRAGRVAEAQSLIAAYTELSAPKVNRVASLANMLDAFSASLRGDHAGSLARYAALLESPGSGLTAFDRAVVHGNFGTALWIAGDLQQGAMRLMDCLSAMLGLRSDHVRTRRLDLKAELERLVTTHPTLKHRFANAAAEGPVQGMGLPLASKRHPLSGEGYLLIGDAGHLIDPFTGEGISHAMISGAHAADVAHEALREGRTDPAFLRTYDARVWKRLGQELAIRPGYRTSPTGHGCSTSW